jgi:tRNA/tmRNA/rRNA uracil-C5-methylase (TrmA/RlmC/RlmD family)
MRARALNPGPILSTLRVVKASERVDVTPHTIDAEGDGLALLGEHTVSCAGLFPGEQGVVRIDAVSKQRPRAYGTLYALIKPRPDRRLAPCPQHPSRGGYCTGCALMPLTEPAQRDLKRQFLADHYGLHVDQIHAGTEALGYRYAGKRVALTIGKRLTLGSYVRGTHHPANMSGCLVDHPLLVSAFESVQAAARAMGLMAYDPSTRRGELRHVWGKTDGQTALVTLLVRNAEAEYVAALVKALPAGLGVFVSAYDADGNAMRGGTPMHVRGPKEATLQLLGEEVGIDALGFLQPNPAVAALAYAAFTDVSAIAGPRRLAFDLYAGAGFTTRALARSFEKVSACESYPESARRLGVEASSADAFLARILAVGAGVPELVLANPPRKGLGTEVVQSLLKLGAPHLHIMSCGPEALARDLQQLCDAPGGYRIVSLQAFDTLPQTPHIELVAQLARVPSEP